MEATAQTQSTTDSSAIRAADLFGEELPSMKQINKLSQQVHSSEHSKTTFSGLVEQNMSKTGGRGCLATGIGLFILGRDAEAVEKLQKGTDCNEKYAYLAFALRCLGRFDEAIENLQVSVKHGADALEVALNKAATFRVAGKLEASEKELKGCANFKNVSAEYHYQLGRLLEAQGFYTEAMDNYKAALELSPAHNKAAFRLAFRCDLSGDEDAAIDYYKQIASGAPVYVNALLNLSVIYEDRGDYDKAAKCVEKVLACHPNHKRAILFLKDIESSKSMVYDEETEKKITRKLQILETPISDFELSVRSRNCLKKMNINTLGDLLRTTETELLSFKNFGETSLREIKTILDAKGLILGMGTQENAIVSPELAPPAVTEKPDVDQGLLSKLINDLQWSVRVKKALQKLNIHTVGDLTRITEAELLGCKNFGVTSLNEVKRVLANLGLSLRTLE
jgi:DNA-directed RNA polymerase subunit alpha